MPILVVRVRPAGVFAHSDGPLAISSHCLYNGRIEPSSHWLYMTAEKRLKTAQVNLRLEPKLKVAAEKAAESDHRSLTSLVEKLLTEYLRERGFLKK
jgi:hypothetical protein